MEFKNKTREDAYERIAFAKIGTASSSEEFLLSLRRYLHIWIDEINEQLYNLYLKRKKDGED